MAKFKGRIQILKGVKLTLLCLLLLLCCLLPACGSKGAKPTLGVWWWSDTLGDEYLDFAKDNSVTEIYYCTTKFDQGTADFIKKANDSGMQVYWLDGKYQWVEDPSGCIERLEKYRAYQSAYQYKFSGVHFDIEPHQHPQFKQRRAELLTKFIELTALLKLSYPDVWIEYDLPFWFEDEIEVAGVTKPAFAHIMDSADRVTIMSYRDTAEKMYRVSEAEIEYAIANGKKLNLSVLTYSKNDEGDEVTFMEEGKAEMCRQIAALRQMLPSDFGIAVHQIKHWYDLKD